MTKRLAALVVIVAMLFVLSGCGYRYEVSIEEYGFVDPDDKSYVYVEYTINNYYKDTCSFLVSFRFTKGDKTVATDNRYFIVSGKSKGTTTTFFRIENTDMSGTVVEIFNVDCSAF